MRTRTNLILALFFALSLTCVPVARANRGGKNQNARRSAKPNAAPRGNSELPLIDLAGYQKLAASYKGKPLVVNFWATWCEPCRTEYPMLIELAKEYQTKGVAFVGVSFDADADLNVVSHFLELYRPVFPNYRQKPGIDVDGFDHAIDPSWNGSIPSTIFYKPDGTFDAQFYGTRPRAEFEKEIRSLTANPFAVKSGTPSR